MIEDDLILDKRIIKVHQDPRHDIPPANTEKCYLLVHEMAVRMNLLYSVLVEMEEAAEHINRNYRGADALKLNTKLEELRSVIVPDDVSPDGPNILNRMNWLFNQVRKNSDKPTQSQHYWISLLMKQADDLIIEWSEYSLLLN
ncbi:MAG TPA: hypothetical protein DEQ09_03195 [Bacteroidales bacterium]|nr:hypothetical protein [Bacteroidales bacterium]